MYSASAGTWFDALDTLHMGLVWWEEVLDDIIEKLGNRCVDTLNSPVDTHFEILNMPHCKVSHHFHKNLKYYS